MLQLDGDPHSAAPSAPSWPRRCFPPRVELEPAAIECQTQAHVEGNDRLDLDLTGRHAG